MTNVGARVRMIDVAGAAGVQFREVVFPFLVPQVHHALPGEDHAVASVAGRHDAVEHIHTAFDSLQDVPWRAYAHEVTGLVDRQDVVAYLDHVVHHFCGFTYGESAYGVSVAIEVAQMSAGVLAQVGVGAALHDGEEMLAVAVEIVGAVKLRDASIEPSVGTVHRIFGVAFVGRAGTAFIEGHHDVGTYGALDVHHVLGREEQFTAVDMRRETYAFFGHLADVGEREDLEAAAVGEDRTCPSLEGVQSTGLTEYLRTRAQVEMIGVAQDDLCMDVVFQFTPLYTLDGTNGADGHEDRREDVAMIGMYHSRTRTNPLRLAM